MKAEYKIAVRALVEFVLRSGNIESGFISSSRAIDAIRAHQKIQKSRPAHYQPEVSVDFAYETELFRIKLGGRIDGVYETDSGAIVEEIKTTTRPLTYFDQYENRLHWGQLKLYTFIYAEKNGLKSITAHLTYCRLDHFETKTYEAHFKLEALQEFFDQLIDRYINWMQSIDQSHRLRNQTAEQINFPYPDYRPGQRQMAVDVYRTIKSELSERRQLLIQAPTGIGKTMAAIFPSIKTFPEHICEKVFYLTARTTGRFVAEKALDELRCLGLHVKTLTLTAKEKICANPGQACHPDECDVAKGHFDRINDALADIFQKDAFTPELIAEYAKRHQVCPFEFSLDLSLWADIIICDYNYVFDPRVYLKRFFQEQQENYIVLIDEAHNLVDRSREMFSAVIQKQTFLDVRRALGEKLPGVRKILTKINTLLLKYRKACEAENDFLIESVVPDKLCRTLTTFLRISEKWLALNETSDYRDALLELYFEVNNFLRIAELFSSEYVTVHRKTGKAHTLKLFCVDPGKNLNQALARCHIAIFFSATMTPLPYFKTIFGCHADAQMLMLPSPFPRENLSLFLSDKISTYYKQREKTADQVAEAILTVIHSKKGNYLIYFPSYTYMSRIYEVIEKKTDGLKLHIQTPSMSEAKRIEFLQCFQADNPDTVVGFAVMGGIFGEGIDLVGDRLCGSVIVGVGLPAISKERDLLKDYFETKYRMGFEYAYLYPGINRVLQAAGRVIRTETDRGVVLLIDQRYNTYRYRSLLPQAWQPLFIRDADHLASKIKAFWADHALA